MRIKYKDDQKRLLMACGVPKGLLVESTINADKMISNFVSSQEKPLAISKKNQIDTLDVIRKAPIKKKMFIMHSEVDYLTLRRYLVPWFWNNVKYAKDHAIATQGVMPAWHYLHGSFEDNLIDRLLIRDPMKEFLEQSPLIVVDGINTDQPNVKNDKLRDIINLASNHALILLVNGKDVAQFFNDKIGHSIKNNFVSFTHARSVEVI